MVDLTIWASREHILLFSFVCLGVVRWTVGSQEVLTNSWLVEISQGGEEAARDVAKRAGFTYVSPVSHANANKPAYIDNITWDYVKAEAGLITLWGNVFNG